jgi:hypothetical protein
LNAINKVTATKSGLRRLAGQVAAAIMPPERRVRRSDNVFRAFAALALASTAAHTSPPLNSTAPWWERVTVTVTDDGQTQSCRYETSVSPQATKDCSVAGTGASLAKASSSSGAKDQVTRITFERRFSPTATSTLSSLGPGETLLGGQVMALAIDGAGAVKGCKVVATSGSVTPQYGCDEAATEHFEASATSANARTAQHQGYMTILVYGHSEHVV